MRFCRLKIQNLVLKIDLVNRRWVVYSRAYGISITTLNFPTIFKHRSWKVLTIFLLDNCPICGTNMNYFKTY